MLTPSSTVIDVRQIPPPQRHTTIFGKFDELLPGEALQIVSDELWSRVKLRQEFSARRAAP